MTYLPDTDLHQINSLAIVRRLTFLPINEVLTLRNNFAKTEIVNIT